ncbi:hypothetical protein EC844_12320 [Acinetobacter calcoaceticus]|uniref:Uncharacterized protein n=1 Tax=Acinetobacter calcoaceticus TaxID=471 RepID=A0A4R1XHQ3_ACICA|nr:hypothetical protein EC844_12320 [Acinetobacter calcoaceticus]
MMKLIEHEAHFWELYQQQQQYFLAIAVDMSSVVSCWDLVLTELEIDNYQALGRSSIAALAKSIIDAAYKGDFSLMESRTASAEEKMSMQACYQAWCK